MHADGERAARPPVDSAEEIDAMSPTVKSPASTAAPRTATLDQRLDEALEESFPASDPPSLTRAPKSEGDPAADAREESAREESARERKHLSEKLDEALEETFPASDTPSLVQPGRS
jgi:hypothetical protein